MSARDDLNAEFSRQRQFLDGLERTDHPAALLVEQQMRLYLAELSQELQAIERREIDIRVAGDLAEQHSLPASFFSHLITRFQGAFAWATWAYRSGPKVSGTLPTDVERSAALDVLALAPGSFRFALRRAPASAIAGEVQQDLETGDDPREKALDAIVAVLRGAAEQQFNEDVEEAVRDMGPRASKSLRLFARELGDRDASLDVFVRTEEPTYIVLPPDGARALSGWLAEVEDRLDEFEVDGVLRVIDSAHGRFGIIDTAEALYEGKAAPELLSGAVEGRSYRARIQSLRRVADHTGATTERLTLLGLEPR
jgi:hypothetical protein